MTRGRVEQVGKTTGKYHVQPGARGTASRVMEYLTKSPNVEVSVGDIAKDLNATEAQVKTAIYYIRHNPEWPVVRIVVPGRVFMYVPNADKRAGLTLNAGPAPQSNGRRVFQEVGKTRDGDFVIECEDGMLYLAKVL